MKTAAILLLMIFIGAARLTAQGTFAFQNSPGFPVKVATGNDAASLAGATAIGAGNPLLGPASAIIELFVAPDGTPLATLEGQTPVGRTLNSGSSAPGFQGVFQGGNAFVLPAPFDGTGKIEYAFYGYSLNGQYGGWSAVGTGYTPATGAALPADPFGTGPDQIGSWTLTPLLPVPEPATMALGGLGALVLLCARRYT